MNITTGQFEDIFQDMTINEQMEFLAAKLASMDHNDRQAVYDTANRVAAWTKE